MERLSNDQSESVPVVLTGKSLLLWWCVHEAKRNHHTQVRFCGQWLSVGAARRKLKQMSRRANQKSRA